MYSGKQFKKEKKYYCDPILVPMIQNKSCSRLLQLLFLFAVIAFAACKKDDKDQPKGYELKIVSGNHLADSSNKQTSTPLVIAVYKDGKQLERNDFYPYTVTLNNFVCGTEELSDYEVSYQADGTVHLYWFTGEVAGTQRVVVTLKDNAGASLAQTEASVDLTLNPGGWRAACQKPEGFLVAAADLFFIFHEDGGDLVSDDGITWKPTRALPMSAIFGGHEYRPKVVEHNDIIYAMFPNIFYPLERCILSVSTNRGSSWTFTDYFPNDCLLLAAINEETLIFSFPGGLTAHTYKDGVFVKSELLINAGSFIDFALNDQYGFALDKFGGLYRATGYNGKYTLVNEALKLQKMLVKGNALYGFSGNKVYRSEDNGNTFTLIANIPGTADSKVENALASGDLFYIISSVSNNSGFVTSTSDWLTFTHQMGVRIYNSIKSPNFCIKKDGTVLFQKNNGSLLYKKP